MERPTAYDDRKLLQAMARSSPCPIEIRSDMNRNYAVRYHPDDGKIYVYQGLDTGTIFRSVTQEMGIASYAREGRQRSECEFEAYALRSFLPGSVCGFHPFRTHEILDRHGFYLGRNAITRTAIILDQSLLLNGGGFVIGTSGSGKSVFIKLLITKSIFMIDCTLDGF